jgi:PAS domain S-box-containing protein
MANQNDRPDQTAPSMPNAMPNGQPRFGSALRRQAEAAARENATPPENSEALSPEETRQILHDLRVHQIELEMQNEDLRRTQLELSAAQARYFDLYDLAPVGYCTVSESGLILEANLTAATLLGVTRSALIKQPLTRFILKEDQDLYYLHRKQLFKTGKPLACELRMVKRDGVSFWARLEATAAQAPSTPATGLTTDGALHQRTVLSDISERKRAEEALRQSESWCHSYFELPYVLTDLNGLISSANRTAAALLGVRQDFLIGKSLLPFIDDATRTLLVDQMAQWQNTDLNQLDSLSAILRSPLQLRVYKGAPFPAEIALSPARDEQGRLTGLRWMLRDLSESARATHALQEREYHYRTLFDNAGDAIFIHNLTGCYLEVNRVACESLGYTRDELLHMTPADINAPELVNQIPDRIARLRQEGHIFFETIYIRRDGTAIPVELNSRTIEYAGGPAVLSIARDITQRKQAEEMLTHRAVQLALLSNIGRQIAAILSLEQVLDRAAHLVQESFNYHHVALFLADHDQGEFVMKAIAGNFIQLFPLNHRIQLDSGMVGWVGTHGERLLANDVRTEPHYINFYPDVITTCSELSVPIRVGEQTVGVLDVQSPVFDDFDENDVRVIETLADQIAVAIANARLYEAAQQARDTTTA